MKQAASEYPLELDFIGPGNVFRAGVRVVIKDRAGAIVLDARSDGPILLARLPDGDYTISAGDAGEVETRHVAVSRGKHATLVFTSRG
jgi:hypothetical protein